MFCCVTRGRNWAWLKTKHVSAHGPGLRLVLALGWTFAVGLAVVWYGPHDWRCTVYLGPWAWKWIRPWRQPPHGGDDDRG